MRWSMVVVLHKVIEKLHEFHLTSPSQSITHKNTNAQIRSRQQKKIRATETRAQKLVTDARRLTLANIRYKLN